MPTYQPPRTNTTPRLAAGTRGPARRLYSSRSFSIGHPEGWTVYKLNGTWYEALVPTTADLNNATHVFLGGHIYTVTQAIYDELVAAGFA